MRWPKLLAHFSLRFTGPDDSGVASIREGLLGRLRTAGWSSAGARSDGGAAAWRPLAHHDHNRDEAFLEARIDAYQEVLEGRGPRAVLLLHMVEPNEGVLPPTEAEVDARLLAAFVRGDVTAFDTLVERYASRLHGQARPWLPAANAVDAVQGAFMRLFERATRLLEHGDVKVGGFLFSSLRFKILHALDNRSRVWLLRNLGPSSSNDGLPALLRRQDDSKLAHHLDRECNPLEQEVMALDIEDRSVLEIAAELGVPEGHVRVIRHGARAKLRRALNL